MPDRFYRLSHACSTCVSKLFERLCPQDCFAGRSESKLEVYLIMRHYVVLKLSLKRDSNNPSTPAPSFFDGVPRGLQGSNAEVLPRSDSTSLWSPSVATGQNNYRARANFTHFALTSKLSTFQPALDHERVFRWLPSVSCSHHLWSS